MLTDEQTYPIEKLIEPDDVPALSAYQIAVLLHATDHEALLAAAVDYTATAQNLERTADTIRRNATDLANAWRGHAAGDSLNHLRQYYASARSLAANCRTSAQAMHHAAQALAQARALTTPLPGDPYPSLNPTSPQSIEYQTILAALNTAYHEAITMAPNQLAISLPANRSIDGAEWSDRQIRSPHYNDNSKGPTSGSLGNSPSRPQRLPVVLPPLAPRVHHTDRMHDTEPRADLHEPRHDHLQTDVPRDIGRNNHGPQDVNNPFNAHTSLAGEGGRFDIAPLAARPSGSRTLMPARLIGGLPTGSPDASPASASRLGGPSGPGGTQGGFLPTGGKAADESERERRYYLLEDPDVWGTADAVPSVIYGEFVPPTVFDGEDDDDEF
jgi:uncharacterized protein YukE